MTKKKSEKTEEKKVSEETVAEETETENTEEPAKDENADKIKALEDELSAQKDKYMRLAAEYDNYRKRTANEKLSIYDDATSKACIELLPVADSVTLALANLKDADPDIIKGIELISNQLAKSFEKLKIESYGKAGDAFDPNLHNAVSKIEDENLGADTIAAVYQTGYKIGDKIVTDFIYKYSAENTQTKTIKNSIGGIYHG